MTDFHVIIPARYESSRLPGKLMMDLGGKTIIQRSYEQALLAKPKSIVIATDSPVIATHAESFGASIVLTASTHTSGTERLAEVVSGSAYQPQDIVVNVQADEPFMAPELILQVAKSLSDANATDVPMATLCWPIESMSQRDNPNVVKVVRCRQNNALYFSRSAIPAHRDSPESIQGCYRHIGLYAYRAAFFEKMLSWSACELESAEVLEQLRVLWMGYRIRVEEACVEPLPDINTEDDLVLARQFAQ